MKCNVIPSSCGVMQKNIFRHTSAQLALFACLFVCAHLHAQYENGGLVGTVRDGSGAPIANAAVAITNTGTAATTQTKTNGSGDYDVPSLRVGVYTIKASAP